MKPSIQSALLAAAIAAATSLPLPATAAPGGHGFSGRGFSASGWHGAPGRGRVGHWGHRGYWPGVFWGGLGLGIGIGAVAYYGGYGGYYAPYPSYGYYAPYPSYGGYYYDSAPVLVAPSDGFDGAPRSARPVPQTARAPEPIFYPRNGQSDAAVETDRRDCNRWATTQPGAMADASIFQRATLACMEGRGYSVK